MSDEDRFITRTTFEDGDEVTSYYDKRSGIIFETRVPSQHVSLNEMAAALGIDVDQLLAGMEFIQPEHHA